jgi:hypothetical protein
MYASSAGRHHAMPAAVLLLPIAVTDVDGDGIPSARDFIQPRNHFVAPPFVNLDARLSKRFRLRDRVEMEGLIEFFNVLNRANPSEIQGAATHRFPSER